MTISANLVKSLREATGAGMMDCKKALQSCDGDLEQAQLYLQKKGIADSKKRAGRSADEGLILAKVHEDGRDGLLIEVNCETDFVARTDGFQAFANALGEIAARNKAQSVSTLLEQDWDGMLTQERLLEQSGKTGEKLAVRRLSWVGIPDGSTGMVGQYIHDGGKIGVIIALTTASEADIKTDTLQSLAKDLAMHIAASDPFVVSADDLDASLVARQTEIFEAQALDSGKPANIAEKIVMGRLNKWKGEVTLLAQPFVKDPDVVVDKHIGRVSKELSGPAKVVSFVRFRLGESLEQ